MKTVNNVKRIITFVLLLSFILSATCLLFACNDDKPDTLPDANGTSTFNTNKAEYFDGEEIYVTAKADGDAWVGLYRESDDYKNVSAIRYYSVAKNGFVSGNTYAFKKSSNYSESRQAMRNIPRGNYTLILFGNGDVNSKKESVKITVQREKLQAPSAPKSLAYDLKNANDGLADGTLKITFDKNSYAEEVVLYWANNNGILENYTSLAPFFVTKEEMGFEMYSNTIIPPEATKLVAYSKNSLGLSADCCEVALPQGCQFDFGGDAINEFQVVSDIHVTVAYEHIINTAINQSKLHDEHLLAMCNDVLQISPNSKGIFVVGDIANAGYEYEWKHAQDLFASVTGLPSVYFTLGNHDLYNGAYSSQVKYFYQYASTDSAYYETVIDGYHHLILGSERTTNGLDAYLSDEQLTWLDTRMSALTAAEPNKPVFVYLHQSLYDTIAGSFEGQGWDGVVQNDEFRAIVAKYPQIYMFNGHSHWDMNTRGSMHDRSDGLPNIFNTASVAYLWSSYYVPTGEYLEGSQGYYIKVYADKVLVLGRDFVNGKWIPSACFVAKI